MSAENSEKIKLSDRGREIIRTIVTVYLKSAEPVGSRTVSRLSDLGLSPATVRNIMADLEEMGLLEQPHTSAGRMPTEQGLRYYVDHLLEKERLSGADMEAIERSLETGDDPDGILKRAVRVLADVTGHAALASSPRPRDGRVLHVEFVRLHPGDVLVLMVFRSGIVHSRLVHLSDDISEDRLRRLSMYLDRKLSGMGLREARRSIISEMKEDKYLFDRLFEQMLDEGVTGSHADGLYIGGQGNLLDQPEFSDAARLKALLTAFEDKKTIVELMDKAMSGGGVQILIGKQGLGAVVPGCGAVVAPYPAVEESLGSLGVVGPMRMDYGRISAVLEYTADILSGKIKE